MYGFNLILIGLLFDYLKVMEKKSYIKAQPQIPIEKLFSKTHAPVFGLGLL
tara:strand:- start:439 stop:591 length:153 start_codon:yes stop_codon:yes gene_type:complete